MFILLYRCLYNGRFICVYESYFLFCLFLFSFTKNLPDTHKSFYGFNDTSNLFIQAAAAKGEAPPGLPLKGAGQDSSDAQPRVKFCISWKLLFSLIRDFWLFIL